MNNAKLRLLCMSKEVYKIKKFQAHTKNDIFFTLLTFFDRNWENIFFPSRDHYCSLEQHMDTFPSYKSLSIKIFETFFYRKQVKKRIRKSPCYSM